MSWDDTPFYQKAINAVHLPEKKRPEYENWKGLHKSSSSPSPILSWWLHESAKRSNGEFNEIDLAEIKAALKGTVNKWSKRVNKEIKFFKDFVEHVELNNKPLILAAWHEIKAISV